MLANQLGLVGLSVLVLEKDAEIYPLPRAIHFDGEVMRIFQSAGLADRMATIARASTKGMHFVSASGQTLLVRRGVDGAGPGKGGAADISLLGGVIGSLFSFLQFLFSPLWGLLSDKCDVKGMK